VTESQKRAQEQKVKSGYPEKTDAEVVRALVMRVIEGYDTQVAQFPSPYRALQEVVAIWMTEAEAAQLLSWLTCSELDKG
jgi:hypothetical protein